MKTIEKTMNWRPFSSTIIWNGFGVRFIYANGACYECASEEIRLWFSINHYSETQEQHLCQSKDVPIVSIETVYKGDGAIISFGDGIKLLVGWDCVLRFCEPDYEYFGGFFPHLSKRAKSGDAEAAYSAYLVAKSFSDFGKGYHMKTLACLALALKLHSRPAKQALISLAEDEQQFVQLLMKDENGG